MGELLNLRVPNLQLNNWRTVEKKTPVELVEGRTKTRSYILIPTIGGYIIEPLFHWLWMLSRTVRSEDQTLRDYTYKLKRWWDYLLANDLQFDHATKIDLSAFIDALLERGNTPTTVNQYLKCIEKFYEFCAKFGYSHVMRIETNEVFLPNSGHEDNLLAHIGKRKTIEISELRVPQLRTERFKVISVDTFNKLATVLAEDDEVYRTIAIVMITTGLRISGVMQLLYGPTKENPDFITPAERKHYGRTGDLSFRYIPKGGTRTNVRRSCIFPQRTWGYVWDTYVRYYRTKRAQDYQKTHGKRTAQLWLLPGGKPVTRQDIWNAFARASKEIGIKVVPHMLRHAYATIMVDQFFRARNLHPATRFSYDVHQFLMEQLGHRQISTTIRYIHTAAFVRSIELFSQLKLLVNENGLIEHNNIANVFLDKAIDKEQQVDDSP